MGSFIKFSIRFLQFKIHSNNYKYGSQNRFKSLWINQAICVTLSNLINFTSWVRLSSFSIKIHSNKNKYRSKNTFTELYRTALLCTVQFSCFCGGPRRRTKAKAKAASSVWWALLLHRANLSLMEQNCENLRRNRPFARMRIASL